ncbi:trehalose-6-phosphate synthase [Ktedonobacter sp. SOSP1-85]|uniref:trehalose-6-phosphate synthase n=1 Tax=Ktedonobacter sp. SOSP1-85 TaxID=2778367 RepID=UPI001916AF7F|nr:trehalose-6-phosphate synthase [Ktedonobacter sp. SOSP1-85]
MPSRIIVVSNAGPAKFNQSGDATLSAGGVVTALSGLGSVMGGFTWVQAPATPAEFGMAARGNSTSLGQIRVVLGKLSPEQRAALYTRISNGILVHCALYQEALARPMLSELGGSWDRTWNLFTEGSQAMVQAALEQVLSTSRGTKFGIFFEDYQMVLTPGLARRLLEEHGRDQDVSLQMHIHTTWAGPSHWNVLPAAARADIARGMLGADTLGFHSQRDARNFADCVKQWLPSEARVSGNTVWFSNHTVTLIANPIGIDTREMTSRLASPGGSDAIAQIERKIDGRPHVFAGIGRTDPTKKLDVLLRAFDLYLRNNPERVSASVLLLHLTESRLDVPVYKQHNELLKRLVKEINQRYRAQAGGRDVVEAYYASDPYLHFGLYARYTVLAVPSERDGFALTAVEGPWVNQRDGVLILSTGTGAYELLADSALRFEPGRSLDDEVEQLARLLQQGSEMPQRERANRQKRLRNTIQRHNLAAWLKRRLSVTR